MVERKRHFDIAEQERLLAGLGDARRVLIRAAEQMPRRSLIRAGTEQLVGNIDELAQLLTGSREYFWQPKHRTPGA